MFPPGCVHAPHRYGIVKVTGAAGRIGPWMSPRTLLPSSPISAIASPFRGATTPTGGVRYVNVPINSGRDPALDARAFAAFAAARSRAEAYAVDVDFNRTGFARIASTVAGIRRRPADLG